MRWPLAACPGLPGTTGVDRPPAERAWRMPPSRPSSPSVSAPPCRHVPPPNCPTSGGAATPHVCLEPGSLAVSPQPGPRARCTKASPSVPASGRFHLSSPGRVAFEKPPIPDVVAAPVARDALLHIRAATPPAARLSKRAREREPSRPARRTSIGTPRGTPPASRRPPTSPRDLARSARTSTSSRLLRPAQPKDNRRRGSHARRSRRPSARPSAQRLTPLYPPSRLVRRQHALAHRRRDPVPAPHPRVHLQRLRPLPPLASRCRAAAPAPPPRRRRSHRSRLGRERRLRRRRCRVATPDETHGLRPQHQPSPEARVEEAHVGEAVVYVPSPSLARDALYPCLRVELAR